ncbi:MAG: peptide synthase [Planctomycetota bacterium]|nr:MAG: peptide synthase [Planctomycetota bacterium]
MPSQQVNVARRMSDFASRMPEQAAVVEALSTTGGRYRTLSFAELDRHSNEIASGLRAMGAGPGTRLALLVPPGVEFVALVFGLLKSGVVAILIDPGMGRKNLVRCLAEAEPEGLVAVSRAQAVRTLLRHRFPKARLNVTVGRRWFWGGPTLSTLRAAGHPDPFETTSLASDPAAIIFTTGSTGPPKGVLYRHGNFDQQVVEIRDRYGIEPGSVNLAAFPLFGLFNAAMGVTTVFPRMDFTRPADVDPEAIRSAVADWKASEAFASPALWKKVAADCQPTGKALATLRHVYSAGAPVPGRVIANVRSVIHPDGVVHTPYGATEALPVATISDREILTETQAATDRGAGVCVGMPFPGIDWKVLRIVDGPLAEIESGEELPAGEIGELLVTGPVVTHEYCTRVEANRLAKTTDREGRVWHRMGDAGYLDPQGRFWFCGRVAHRVLTAEGTRYTIPAEGIVNTIEGVARSALVGVGPPGVQLPVLVIEPTDSAAARSEPSWRKLEAAVRERIGQEELLAGIEHVLCRPRLPVDIRHNAKIFREQLSVWAASRIG